VEVDTDSVAEMLMMMMMMMIDRPIDNMGVTSKGLGWGMSAYCTASPTGNGWLCNAPQYH